jgi:hypothetical protein
MEPTSTEYNFTLTRRQRFYSLVAGWWKFALCLGVFVIVAIPHAAAHPVATSIIALFWVVLARGLIFGLLDLFGDGKLHVEIQEHGVGVGKEKADWWVFTDGIKEIRTNRWGTTSILHDAGGALPRLQ